MQVCILSVLTSILFFALPLGGRCRACNNADADHCLSDGTKFRTFHGYHCGEGSYNDLSVLVFNPQVGACANLCSLSMTHQHLGVSLPSHKPGRTASFAAPPVPPPAPQGYVIQALFVAPHGTFSHAMACHALAFPWHILAAPNLCAPAPPCPRRRDT